ncbi:MAG: NUDIX hydrolase [Verrucomicrobia bacterium]|nr:NUDIX hydrolase [Verrucomicrobiota bacterium]
MKVLKSTNILTAALTVRKDHLQYPSGYEYDYYVVTSKPKSVAIIALSASGELLVTKEYRHPVQTFVYGLPGGLVDANETPLQAAKRELLEETGYTADSFEELGRCFPLPSVMDQEMTVVLARNARELQKPTLEATEVIEALFIPIDQIRTLAPLDGVMCAALFFTL